MRYERGMLVTTMVMVIKSNNLDGVKDQETKNKLHVDCKSLREANSAKPSRRVDGHRC